MNIKYVKERMMTGPTGDAPLDERVPIPPDPGEERVKARAAELEADRAHGDPDDPEIQARAILEDSDARVEDPAARTLEDGRVERRTSEEATPPPES